MKLPVRTLVLLLGLSAFTACKKDEVAEPSTSTPSSSLQVLQSATHNGYTLELLNSSGKLEVGHNPVLVRIKDGNGNALENATLSWEPMMTMDMGGSTHQHSCPYSSVAASTSNPALYEGYVVFNMATSSTGFWEMTLTYDVGNGASSVTMPVNVLASDSEFRKRYTSAVGTDGVTYLLAMVEPSQPTTGVNNMVVGLYKRVSGTEFPVVDNYTIRVDPRMPGMGNHGAPGNVDLTQGADGFYHGSVGFSMTGYWKINLIVEDGAGTALAGNAVTDTQEESSVHFKVNF